VFLSDLEDYEAPQYEPFGVDGCAALNFDAPELITFSTLLCYLSYIDI
jgi:hypothetical protein